MNWLLQELECSRSIQMHLGIMMKLPLGRDLNVNGVLPVLRAIDHAILNNVVW